MRITFPARHCENYNLLVSQPKLIKLIKTILEDLNWKYNLISNNEFQAQISSNFWSHGEKIKIITQNEGILICSECISPWQCFDWGKNKENVKTFLSNLETMKGNLLSNNPFQNVESFDKAGLSPVERAFEESE